MLSCDRGRGLAGDARRGTKRGREGEEGGDTGEREVGGGQSGCRERPLASLPGYEGERERVRGKTKGRREVILKWDRYASPSRASPRALCLRLPRSPRLPSPLVFPLLSFTPLIYSAARFIPRTYHFVALPPLHRASIDVWTRMAHAVGTTV